MSINIIELIKGQFGHGVTSQLASQLGEKEEAVSKATNALIPTVLGGIVSQSDKSSLLQEITQLVDTSILSKLSQESSFANELLSKVLTMVFGDKIKSITSGISSFAGVKESSADALLGFTSLTSLATIGRYAKDQNLDSNGLETLLNKEKTNISNLVPVGFSLGAIGLGNLENKTEEAKATLTENIQDKVSDIKDGFSEKLDESKEKFSQFKDNASEKLSETSDMIKDKVSDLKEDLSEKLDESKEKLAQFKDNASEKLSETSDMIKDKVSDLKEDLSEKLDESKEKLAQFKDNASEKLSETSDSIKKGFSDFKESASNKLDNLKEKVEEKTGEDVKEVSVWKWLLPLILLLLMGWFVWKQINKNNQEETPREIPVEKIDSINQANAQQNIDSVNSK
ncbi:apolipoprotein A1/A4/E family protein [Riemerella anatipestifer]|nr:apolipoprotein A1/A4/E family protein [Riemerella anatipestifer]MDY3357600.1 apolipoprotein A1/A4/E family protein [Riemerella anatipestifer]